MDEVGRKEWYIKKLRMRCSRKSLHYEAEDFNSRPALPLPCPKALAKPLGLNFFVYKIGMFN